MDIPSKIDKIFEAYPMYHKVGGSAYKAGLENIERLLEAIGHPEKRFRSVHVAGTNGKGSVSHLLASFCKENGLKTGLFTSPHLVDFSERIRIDGQNISGQDILDFFDHYQSGIKDLEPSFFELTTAIAFDYFATREVDIAIIEVGLGGRLDSTNVISPLLSVITNISLEHTAILGDTIAKIANEKAGIIKKETPVVIGELHPESLPVFDETAKRKKSPLLLASQLISAKFSAGSSQDSSSRNLIISKEGKTLFDNIASPLTGSYQEKNIATYTAAALELCRIMGFSADKIKDGIENVQKNFVLNGRWQIVDKSPLTICDTGHNPGCLTETMAQIKSLTYQKLHFVIGFVNDKDIETIFTLLPREAQYYACAASVERAFPASELTKKMSEAGFKTEQCSTVTEAYSKAKANAKNEDVIFVGGSTFVVADFIKGEKAHFSLS